MPANLTIGKDQLPGQFLSQPGFHPTGYTSYYGDKRVPVGLGGQRQPRTWLKRFASTVPGFRENPQFTFNGAMLEFVTPLPKADSPMATFRINPAVLGLDAALMERGTVISVDLTSL